ncbi:MAG TPA: hypothetical protein VLI06_12620 [Solimonas sp.]|nr:hypothetical protein [Solimonas sp.]
MKYGRILSGMLLALVCGAGWAGANGLVGSWQGSMNGQPVSLELRADNTGSFNGQALNWQTLGGTLLLEQNGDVMPYAYELQGSQLTVGGGDLGAPVQLQRGQAGRATAAKRPSPSASAAGVRPELAGHWCYVSSFSAVSGGGSQTSRCFQLGPDGRYSYQSEGSMSAYAPGAWGGTSSSSSDSGRWSATANSITANSDNGGSTSYPMELRNHPKTRDPMICLDGDCYVTQRQKASW